MRRCPLFCLLIPLLGMCAHAEPPVRTRAMDTNTFELVEDGQAVDGQHVQGTVPPRRLRLAILPDRTTGRDWGLPYLDTAIDDLARLRPDAVFCVGDLIQGYTRDPEQWDREAAAYLDIVNRLNSTFYPTAGNHDVISGRRDPNDRTFVDRYRRTFGPLHYSVELEGATMVVLFSDESLDDRNVIFSDAQLTWLEDVLEDAAERPGPIVLLMHRPLWRYGKVNWDSRVHPLLVKHGVDAVLAGHFHALHREPDRDGVQYHLLGVCGGSIDQHPLTGQLHHLTMLDLGPDDELSIFHLPVGVTLPDDFVLRADQDRAYKLKKDWKNAEIRGVLEDPVHGPVDASAELILRNPLDRTVRFEIAPATPVDWWSVPGRPFIARTPKDIRNTATTDYESPFMLKAAKDPIELEPGGSRTLPLGFTANTTPHPPRPPQLMITATFRDDKGRDVPVRLHRRVPIDRHASRNDSRTRWPISAWRHSVYEVGEEDSTVRLELNGPEAHLELDLVDNLLCAEPLADPDRIRSRNNPPGDLVRITTRSGVERREFLLEPAIRNGILFEVTDGDTLLRHTEGWRGEESDNGTSRLQIRLPGVKPAALEGLQVDIADNDQTFHTQWRRLAPSGDWLRITSGT